MSTMLNVREEGSRVLLHTEEFYGSTEEGGEGRWSGYLEPIGIISRV